MPGADGQNGSQAALGPGVKGFGEESLVADGRTADSLAMFIRSGSSKSALVRLSLCLSVNSICV